jgi:hypothetical protein
MSRISYPARGPKVQRRGGGRSAARVAGAEAVAIDPDRDAGVVVWSLC